MMRNLRFDAKQLTVDVGDLSACAAVEGDAGAIGGTVSGLAAGAQNVVHDDGAAAGLPVAAGRQSGMTGQIAIDVVQPDPGLTAIHVDRGRVQGTMTVVAFRPHRGLDLCDALAGLEIAAAWHSQCRT